MSPVASGSAAASGNASLRVPSPRPGKPKWPEILVVTVAISVVVGGLATLAGWALDIPALTDWTADGISMFPNTAACAALSGLALFLNGRLSRQSQRATVWLATLVSLIGGATLFEHLTGLSLGIDTLLFDRSWGQSAAAAPMRMGPPASISFVLIGTALSLANRGTRARGWSVACGLAVMAIAMLSLIGRLYGAEQMYTIPRLTGIALQTAGMLAALGIGVVASAPDREPMRMILEPTAAGILVRRALPFVIVSALAIGFVRVSIERQDLVDSAFGTALRTTLEILLLTGLLWWSAITVRLHERKLRDSEVEVRRHAGQLAGFLETAAIAIHRLGPDGTILWANDAELQLLGYSREEYVGHDIREFHADRAAIGDMLARLRRGETLTEYPSQMKCKDGSLKSVVVDSSAFFDEGRFVHTQGFTRDITERKIIEETRALLAAIVEASDDAVVSKSLDGVITSWNAGAERLFGYSVAEAVGRSIELVIPPDRLDEERQILERLRRGEHIDHFETVRRTKDGRLIDVSLTISPVKGAAGRITGASKIARDITDRKRAEAERAEDARRKDEFIAILAHELRNPLAPVRNAARYLKLKASPDPELRRSVDMIERQVAQMARLIDDLLDVSRISRGMLELRRERVGCSEIIDAAVEACRDEIEAKGHHLRVSPPAEHVEIRADPERLVQILSNLIGNAAKYTPNGGQIDLLVSVKEGGRLGISVKDNGIGIPPAKLTEIFDLFARVDHSLQRQGGLGIGLTLVRQLVELHGGSIEARSSGVGHGSEFVLDLPVVVAPAEEPAAKSADAGPAARPLRIVVADDNPDAAESLVLLLQLGGHEVHAVFDGEAAAASIEELRPHVALLDIGMPMANGYQVAERIRAHGWGKQIYIVALTGWAQEADKRRARNAGFDAHLVKPVAPEALNELLAAVDSTIRSRP